MIRTRSKILIAVGLILLVLLVAVVAAHQEFPYGKAARLAVNKIRMNSNLELEMDAPEPGRPFKITIPSLRLGVAQNESINWIFEPTNILAELKLGGLLSGNIVVDLTASAWRGRINGTIRYGILDWGKYEINLNKIDLPGFTFTQIDESASITGHLRGNITAGGKNPFLPDSGTGVISMGPGLISGRILAGRPKVDLAYDSINVEFTLKPNRIDISKFTAKGRDLELTMSGQISNYQKPVLNLEGVIGLGFGGKIGPKLGFRLTGTMQKPKVSLGLPNMKKPAPRSRSRR